MPPGTNTVTKTSAAPERSMTQRREALKKANDVRTQRAALKKEVKAGKVLIRTLLLKPPAFIETMKVYDMLLQVPKHGRVKANKALKECRISPSKTFGGLSPRQRTDLVHYLQQR